MEKIDKFNEIITKPYRGRISRKHFIIAWLIVDLSVPLQIIIMMMIREIFPVVEPYTGFFSWTIIINIFLIIPCVKILTQRRGQDYGDSGSSALYPILPFSFSNFFKKGTVGRNEFGDEPLGTFIEEVIFYKSAPNKIDPITHKTV